MNASSPPPQPRQIDSWQLAEGNAVAWMRHWGYGDARQTPGGADGGIDVRSSRALAQVKFEAKQVGAPAVQRLVGARGLGTEQLIFFSGAGYAAPAVQYADVMNVALFKYDLLGKPSAVNPAARALVAQVNEAPAMARQVAAPVEEDTPVKDWFKRNWTLLIGPVLVMGGIGGITEQADASVESDPADLPLAIACLVIGVVVTVLVSRARWKKRQASQPAQRDLPTFRRDP